MIRRAVIIGAQKCGTTALNRAPRSHPQVAACKEKEPDYFSSKYQLGEEWYEGLFSIQRSHKVALDSSTSYTMFPTYRDVPERMRQTGWDFRFVYILRHPIERIRSYYLHAAVEDLGTPPLSAGIHTFPIEVSSYHLQLEQFRRVFDTGTLLLVMHGEMLANPAATLRRVTAHFGLDHDPKIGMETVHSGEWHYHRALIIQEWQRRGGAPAGLNRDNLVENLSKLPAAVRADIERTVQAKYTLTAEHKAEIRQKLANDMRLLRRDYGIEVSRWGFEA